MELKQLEYFVRVAEMGSFTRASIALSVTQPALSRKIRQLEVELRQALFNRNGRGITLTNEGAVLLEHSRGILAQTDRMRGALQDAQSSPAGRVMLAMAGSTGKSFAPEFVTQFRKLFPRASLEIMEGRSRVIHEWLVTGRVDIAILFDPPPSPLMEITPLHDVDLFLFSRASSKLAPKRGPIPFRDLEGMPLILPAPPHSIRMAAEREAAKARIKLDVVLEVEGGSMIYELVQRGQGATIQSRYEARRGSMLRGLQSNEIISPRLHRSLKLAISLQRPTTHLVREAARMITQSLGQESRYAKH
jgi:LysR family nitrogen assimilation transcriptional regulator